MQILHTGDWHVGKTLKGRSRLQEHADVLDQIVAVAADRDVDLVVVAGDTFDTASPSAEAEKLVWATMQRLSQHAPVVLLAGNHDGQTRLDAVARLLHLTNVHVATTVRRPDQGGIQLVDTSAGPVRVALMPWLSQRYVVSAQQLMDLDPDDYENHYAARVASIVDAYAAGMADDAVSLLVGHMTVVGRGGLTLGGGERRAQTVLDYHVSPQVFGPTFDYVALGHIHRAQDLSGPSRTRYAGSPMPLDFGEAGEDPKGVTLADVVPGGRAKVEQVNLDAPRLRTLKGTVAELAAAASTVSDREYVRLLVTEPPRAGLVDELRALVPQAVEVRIAHGHDPSAASSAEVQVDREPQELFVDYLTAAGVAPDDVGELLGRFATLLSADDDQPAVTAGGEMN